jgi:hypothetical protein
LQPLLQQVAPPAQGWPVLPAQPQSPMTQSGARPGRQALPHWPQLFVSVFVSVQMPLQQACVPQWLQGPESGQGPVSSRASGRGASRPASTRPSVAASTPPPPSTGGAQLQLE